MVYIKKIKVKTIGGEVHKYSSIERQKKRKIVEASYVCVC
jgi:hypothetical protein